ncbi:MAG TPA: peptidase MA family metallohydrolase [Polyangiaceae bacterium]|jgi:hypothetical protein
MSRALRLLCAFFLAVAMLGLGGPARAEATQPVANTPRDAPLLLEPTAVKIPSILSDMTSTRHDWLELAYPKSVESQALALESEADTFKNEISAWLGQTVLDQVQVRLARSQEDMNALAPVGAPPPRYAVGVAYSSLHLIIISLREPHTAEATDLPEVLRHELAHVALFDATQGRHVPLWFNEGFAVHASGEQSFNRLHTLWSATLSKSILPLEDLDKSFPDDNQQVSIAYAESADFVRYLLRDEDRARFGSLIERVRKGTPFDRALSDAYGDSTRILEYQWREDLDKRMSYWPMLTGSSMLWSLIVVILAVAFVRRRKKAKETLARWAKEEAEEDRLRAAIVEAAQDDAALAQRASIVPAVQHDGEWHTLH